MGVEIAAAMAMAAPYLSAASMVIGGASAVTGYMAQQEQAKAQSAANAQTAQAALDARNHSMQQLQTRGLQERDAASEKLFESRIQAMEGASSAAAMSAAKGMQGTTVDALAREYYAKQGRQEQSITTTANNTLQQLAAEQDAVQAQYESRINATPSVKEPSLWGLGLGIGKSVSDGARDYVRAETLNTKTAR